MFADIENGCEVADPLNVAVDWMWITGNRQFEVNTGAVANPLAPVVVVTVSAIAWSHAANVPLAPLPAAVNVTLPSPRDKVSSTIVTVV